MERFTLDQLAQMGMDLYFRSYKSDDEFFDLVHFKLLSCTTYAKIINDMFQDDKLRNKGADGFSYVNVTGAWIKTEYCEVKIDKDSGKKYVETSVPCFSFDFDALASSVHSITKQVKGQCGDLMRISNRDIWKLDELPVTSDIYWYQLGEKIWVEKMKCDTGKLRVNYIPAVLLEDGNATIPETMADGIMTTVLQIMFGAKNETMVVKTANNSNPNGTVETEVAPEQKKQA